MTATTITKQAPSEAAIATRQYAVPVVRPLSMATAHPAAEAWPKPVTGLNRAADGQRPLGRRHRGSDASRFTELQPRMAAVEAAARAGRERTVVVVPSR